MPESIPAVLMRYLDGLKRHDVPQIASTVAEDAAIILPTRTLAKPDFLAFLTALYAACPDWRYDHDAPATRADGRFAVRFRQSGTHSAVLALPGQHPLAATGKAIRIPEQTFTYRIVASQLSEIWPDPISGGVPWGILEQLGIA